jgi:hypothetical protein
VRKEFGPPQTIAGSHWKIALNLLFFVDEGSRPLHEVAELKSDFVVLSTPPGSKLAVVLLFGSSSATIETPLPRNFPGETIMRTKLRNGPPVVVVADVLPQTDQDRVYVDNVRRWRSGKFASPPGVYNVEYCEVKSNPNLISIIPLREEDFLETAISIPPSPPASGVAGQSVAVATGASDTSISRSTAGPNDSLELMLLGRD